MDLPSWLFSNPSYKSAGKEAEPKATDTFTASRMSSGKPVVGGRVFATDTRELVFEPLNTDPARQILRLGLTAAGVSGVGLANRALSASGLLDPKTASLADVTHVEVIDGSWTRPPVVRQHMKSGQKLDVGILANPMRPNISRANRRAADDFAAQINALIHGPAGQ